MLDIQSYMDRISAIVGERVRLTRYLNPGKEPTEITGPSYIAPKQTPDAFFYVMKPNNVAVASFCLVAFPGCCGLVISTAATTYYPHAGKGIGKITLELRQALCKERGYTVLVCTDVDHNAPQRKLLNRAGFKDVYQFRNRRTNNLVNISVKHLYDHPGG